MRVFALSDIHVDFEANRSWIRNLSEKHYRDDVLILAGDVSHRLKQFRDALNILRNKFGRLFFVPGNHDLWIQRNEHQHSVEKFWHILDICRELDVHYFAAKAGRSGAGKSVWIVPLFSWYVRPEEGRDSLFLEKPGEDPSLSMWGDLLFTRWPQLNGHPHVASYFLSLNEAFINKEYEVPVITFSHFLPIQDMMFSANRQQDLERLAKFDRNPSFNFSRVAGSSAIDHQLRQIGSKLHVYGHQHRNQGRTIEGVYYLSHCLGYPHERQKGYLRGLEQGPKLIWDEEQGLLPDFPDS